jgi:flagella basal body P-ring formation protein FlgA
VKTAIYALCQPDGEIRYIGKTIRPLAVRFRAHLQRARGGASMKLLSSILSTILLAFSVLASPPDVGFSIDLANPTKRFEYTTFAGNTPCIPVTIFTNGSPYTGFAGYSCELNYMLNDSASSLKTITGTVSSNIATFQALSNSLPAKGDFFCEVYFSTTYGASKITGGQGLLRVNRSPSSNAHGALELVPRINFDTLSFVGTPPWSAGAEPIFYASVAYSITAAMTSQWSQAYLYGPRVTSNEANIAILNTGRVSIATYLAHVAAQTSTNSAFETRITGVETGKMAFADQTATNTYFQGLHTAQGNSNAYYQGLFDAQEASNTYFQAFKTAQGNSNTYFQGLHTAQADTNAGFESRIGIVETGKTAQATYLAGLVTQAATNAGLQAQLTVMSTGKTAQATYLSGLAAQANTNAGYESRISVVETGKTAQATYLAGLVTQAETNAGLQAQVSVLVTGKTDQATYLAHTTAQADTNAGFESRIGIMETGKTAQATYLAYVAAQTATNSAFETRIQEGEEAYDWGDHAAAGYLSGATNIFASLTAGDRTKLGTNIAGLTAGTYTGSLTSVAYTGVTVLAVGKTYVWGFNKINTYGTSTLAIAEHSLTRAASGAASNFFTFTGTDSNLVLTLTGDGSSKSDVTNVYVQLITNGLMNVASDLRVGDGLYLGGERKTAWPSDTNAIWGNISGTLANQIDLTNSLVLRGDTNGWVVSAHTVSGVTAGTYYDGANGDYVSNAVVWKTDTNGWVVSAHEAWLTTEVDPAYATGAVFRVDTNGWEVGSHAAFLTTESDPAYATGAVQLAGATMTGGLTNEHGFYGNGAGLTNLASDPSGWSGYAATQQVVWYEVVDSENIDTNILVLSGTMEPDIAGTVCLWDEVTIKYYNSDMQVSVADQVNYWWLWTDIDSPGPRWKLIDTGYEPIGDYGNDINSTGSVTVAYGFLKATNVWRAGYDTNIGAWAVSRNGTDMQAWYPGSNVLTGPVVIGGVSRESWPSEYSDTAIYNALTAVSNWTIAGSNLAATVAGNLSVVSNQAAAGSNLAFDVGGNLSIVSNQAAAGSNLAYGLSGNLSVVSNQVAGASNLAWAIGAGGSNYADSVGAAVGLVATNLSAGAGLVASNALSRSDGGAVTGNVTIAGSGDLTATNLYLPRFGTVYFGTTNYIRDQGSNLLFHFNTNEAVFNW